MEENNTVHKSTPCVQEQRVPCIVVDPFMGTGAVAVAAVACGLPFIGMDTDPHSLVTTNNISILYE